MTPFISGLLIGGAAGIVVASLVAGVAAWVRAQKAKYLD